MFQYILSDPAAPSDTATFVTTSPQSFVPPSTASSKWLLHRLRVLQTLGVQDPERIHRSMLIYDY